jgi:citrate synthase
MEARPAPPWTWSRPSARRTGPRRRSRRAWPGASAFLALARHVEGVALAALAAHKPDRVLATNVEFYTALLLRGLGLPNDLFTPTFAVARVGGWTAHILEQRRVGRLIRPRAGWVGTDRTWDELEAVRP